MLGTIGLAVTAARSGGGSAPRPRPEAMRNHLPSVLARPNDNRARAGVLANGVLTVHLEVQAALIKPEGDAGPAVESFAFAEAGKPALVPGPLLRVSAGTDLDATVRNTLAKPLTLYGMQDRDGRPVRGAVIAAGDSARFRFRAGTPGTFMYWARTSGNRLLFALGEDGQLVGGLVVDAPEAPAVLDERILVVSLYANQDDVDARAKDSTHTIREAFLVNGMSWPHTERMRLTVGDTLRWRVINASLRNHPMHLHGFYYRVDSRGTAASDSIYAPLERRSAVTELMRPGSSMMMTWSPRRDGNWLFHCHLIAHISPEQRIGDRPASMAHMNHAENGMAGLIVGIEVKPKKDVAAFHEPLTGQTRKLRMFVDQRPNVYGTNPGFGFVLQGNDTPPARDSIVVPGSPVILRRGERSQITVFNRTSTTVTIHWHGIELESFYDGVGDWSGAGTHTAPPIAPGDSFVVRMTPDRAGTFIYHTHDDESNALSSGLYGPLIVLAPGQTWNPETDRVMLMGAGGPGPGAPPLLNGSATPPPIELRAGLTYRFRFIDIAANNIKDVSLLSDTTLVTWRAFAKDGADVPPHQATSRPSRIPTMGPGETYDYEFTPTAAATLTLRISTPSRGAQPLSVMRVPVTVH